ncbi:MAG: peptide deformylase [Lachnospiraceae bacterium]|nr:peptide deformylase [Lachnospiraceae bacterium]
MALRQIRIYGDEKLAKACRPVQYVSPRTKLLIRDMLDTMYEANGVGLAAPQVGILKQIVVIDIGDAGEEDTEDANTKPGIGCGDGPLVMINPEILETSGEQTGQEGCLSLPGQAGMVTRPEYVKVKAFDEDMKEFVVEGRGLLARAICHECDHLQGIMYVEKVEGDLFEVTDEEEE